MSSSREGQISIIRIRAHGSGCVIGFKGHGLKSDLNEAFGYDTRERWVLPPVTLEVRNLFWGSRDRAAVVDPERVICL